MSITGHKCTQSPAIYHKVREDDKCSMEISLTYSLMHPTEVRALLDVIEKEKKKKKRKKNEQKQLEALPVMKAIAPPQPMIQSHALDPANKNILQFESSLVLYEMKQQNEPMDVGGSPQFDLMNILSDLDDDAFDNQMALVATQVEKHFSKTAILKKVNPIKS